MEISSTIRQLLRSAVLVTLAAFFTASSHYFLDRTFFVFLLCAVMASALKDGYWAGAFATFLSLIAYVILFMGLGNLSFEIAEERVIVFLISAAIVSWLAGSRRNALHRLGIVITDLQKALDEVKTLRGLIPICSGCKKIRDDLGDWVGLESYIQAHTGAQFTHGMCQECVKRLYPTFYDRVFPDAL